MDMTAKLHPGEIFEPMCFHRLDGEDYTFGTPSVWQALFVFRGQHCPICTSYPGEIDQRRATLSRLSVPPVRR